MTLPLADAFRTFRAGRAAFFSGKGEADNPYLIGAKYKEWRRGYINARKRARFDATIKTRRETIR